MVLPDSPRASPCNPMPSFHVYPQASCLSWDCSPDVSVVVPSTPAPAPIDLNTTPVAGGSSSGGARKCARQMPTGVLPDACNLFEGMSSAVDEDYMQNLIFEGGAPAASYYPDKTQSQDGRGAFMPATGYDPDQAAFMRDQVAMDLDGFPLDHEFTDDYGQEEEDECDIEVESLFEDELAYQAVGPKPKRKGKCTKEFHERKKFPPYQIVSTRGWVSIFKRWRVIQHECNKFCATLESVKARPVSGISMQDMTFQALEAFKVQHNGKCFNLSRCFRVIKDEEKFKAQYAALKSRGGGGSKPWRWFGTASRHGRGGRPTPGRRISGMHHPTP
ncbi:hypothetical protein VPH35_131483 [Triticum aestivum]